MGGLFPFVTLEAFMANRYRAPLALIHLALNQAATSAGARVLAGYEEVLSDLAGPVLQNAARFAANVLSPLNPVGDRTPSHCESNGVVTPPGFVELVGAVAYHYMQWVGVLAGGWQLALIATTSDSREIGDIAAFYATQVLSRTLAYEAVVRHGVTAVTGASLADL
jgi:hypothetical protein